MGTYIFHALTLIQFILHENSLFLGLFAMALHFISEFLIKSHENHKYIILFIGFIIVWLFWMIFRQQPNFDRNNKVHIYLENL